MKLTKKDIEKIGHQMADCTFDENGFIVDEIMGIEEKPIYCNVCGEGNSVKDIGLVFGQITCVSCANEMGEELRDRGMAQ